MAGSVKYLQPPDKMLKNSFPKQKNFIILLKITWKQLIFYSTQ